MKLQHGRIDGATILTHAGLYVNPLDLQPEQVLTEDIAHALSNQCRYTGHTKTFYSVGEHVVRCTRWLREQGASPDDLRWCLMHDASEAYLVDIPRPLKVDPYFGKAYRGAEDRAMRTICDVYGLPHKMPDTVKEADLKLLATERRDLMPPNGRWVILDGIEPIATEIKTWRPGRARSEFMHEFDRLFGEGA